ncbi:ribulose-phosphate 3-epimerase [Actinomycetaceae bacterium WB03_NA08]|uniref:Ribulose-phosphate 3-epimerase n=1 Tax=Scrofimicrobium canadense TaxID=2652290 RepID=A0A6N7VQ77_9ACTO|nr:ribulose-phosphate 3-epimerase [Scrofimicrobium canadense]MSS83909.1 ribulose-phosphate 3-epimerase [Scrofimicrobium canadense]
MNAKISPSILNSDIAHLADEIEAISAADRVHVDVMDGHFVPNLSWGVPIVQAVAGVTELPIDTHLMIEAPDRWAPDYVTAGSTVVTFHWEAATAPIRLARELRNMGAKAGVALRPGTPVEPILDHLEEFDLVLIMTVEPGFGGQKFLPNTLGKVRAVKNAIRERNLDVEVQVDGGVNRETIHEALAAGADNFVIGSALFSAEDPSVEVLAFREILS